MRSLLGRQFNVTPQSAEYSNAFNALRVAQNSIQAALVASFLIAAVVVVFAVLMLVRERTAEIATLNLLLFSQENFGKQPAFKKSPTGPYPT